MSDIMKGVLGNEKNTAALPKKGSKYVLNFGGVIKFTLFTSHLFPPAHLKNGSSGLIYIFDDCMWPLLLILLKPIRMLLL